LLLLPSEPLSLTEFVAERKVAEQRWKGRESALDASAREQNDRVTDPGRPVDRDDGAYRTTATGQRGLEGQDVVDSQHLADVRAWLGLTVHAERDAADADLGIWREKAQTRQALDGDLLAEVAGSEAERVVCRAIDDHDRALGAMRVRVALDAPTDAPGDLAHGARVLAVTFVDM